MFFMRRMEFFVEEIVQRDDKLKTEKWDDDTKGLRKAHRLSDLVHAEEKECKHRMRN